MKKLLILTCCLGIFFASCTDVKKSREYKEIVTERDSLKAISSSTNEELTQIMGVLNDVEDNFEKIKATEKILTIESQKKEKLSSDVKEKIKENFKVLQDVLAKNKKELAILNQKVAKSNLLKKTVDRLNQEIKDRIERVNELQQDLARKDEKIAELLGEVGGLKDKVEVQEVKINKQDKALNTAYFVYGTMSELKKEKILSGGFLSKTKLMKDDFNKDYFQVIDIRKVTAIPLYAKKAQVWSSHPEGTYEFREGQDGDLIFKITDTQRFWSLTRYLVIEVF